jgi:16S rRNA A1518/A1519 N6-dimethyltransferase RsmA/KsgA/DIM1 with predicted DNA glycosylase/AP lyase activity
MIKVWKYAISTWTNCPLLQGQTQYSALQSMVVMLQNDISKRIFNTLMARDKTLLKLILVTFKRFQCYAIRYYGISKNQ